MQHLCHKWAPIAFSALALVGSLFAAVWAASADRAGVLQQQQEQAARLEDHENRLRYLEVQLPAIGANVTLILETCTRLEQRIDAQYAAGKPGQRMPPNLHDDT